MTAPTDDPGAYGRWEEQHPRARHHGDGTAGAQRPPARRRRRRPRGRGPGPIIVLAIMVAGPAIGLWTLFQWSDTRAQEAEAALADAPATTLVAPRLPPEPLTTPVMTPRRFATIISRDLGIVTFQTELAPFLPTINDRSCVAVSVDGQAVGGRNQDIQVIPASNQKLLVAAVALEVLGADFRYTTSVVAPTGPEAGIVNGDLYLVGGGDPLLSSNWYPTSNLERYPVLSPTSLDVLADAVAAAGITQVTGAVIGDGSRYDDEFFAPGWGNGVAGLDAGPYDALMANDSRVLDDPQKSNDPNQGAAREFTRLLTARGITVGGTPTAGTAPDGAVSIANVDSAPMSEVVQEMLANSDNNTAELVVKEIGFAGLSTGTREAGLDVIEGVLAEWGVDTSQLVLGDGSGLSLNNRLTCNSLLEVLQRFDADSAFAVGLPVAGSTGTLSDIFTDHPVAGRLLGKTGTLNNPPFNADPPAVKALSGYVPVDGGAVVEYALVLNGPTISDQSEYRPVWTDLADVLATYPNGPTPAEIGVR